MYQLNEIELWRQHHEDLVREAEVEHLARQLRAARPNRAARLRNALLGRGRVLGDAARDLRAGESHCA